MTKILTAARACIAFALILSAPTRLLAAHSQQSTPTTQNYSIREIKGMFRGPTSPEQLLRNLKLAYDRNLFVQPAFFEGDVLKRFFNGTTISGSESETIVELDGRIFPGMSVRVHQIKNPIAGHNAPGPPHEYVPAYAITTNYVEVDMGSKVVISVRQIKDIFGDDFQEQLDLGEGTDGHSYTPTTKGSLRYSKSIRGPGPEEINDRGVLFVVKKDLAAPRCVPANQPRNHCGFENDDIIESINLSGSASVFTPAT